MDDFATPRRGVFPSFLAPAGTPGPHLRTPGPQDRQAQPPSADPVIRANEKRAGAKRYSNLGARFELAHGLATRGELDDAHARRKSGSVSPPGGSPPHRRCAHVRRVRKRSELLLLTRPSPNPCSSRGPVDFKGQGPLDDPRWCVEPLISHTSTRGTLLRGTQWRETHLSVLRLMTNRDRDTGLVEIPTWQLAGGGAEAAAAARQEAQPSSSPKGTDGDGTAGGGQSLLGKRCAVRLQSTPTAQGGASDWIAPQALDSSH